MPDILPAPHGDKLQALLQNTKLNAKYFLLCDWLDMTPISTSTTAIDEIIILRRAKRLSSSIRKQYGAYSGRQQNRQEFVNYLDSHPFAVETFGRFVNHVLRLVDDNPENALLRGYF